MSLWKRNRTYWTYIYMDGVRYAKSTGTGNLRQATLIDQRFREELNLRRNQIVEPKPGMTVDELSARFLAGAERKAWHVDRLNMLLPYWSEVQIGRIHKGMIADYRRRRHAAKAVTEATVNRDLQAFRHILNWAVDEGFLTANPLTRLRLVPERRQSRPVLSLDDEAMLLDAAAPHLRPIIVAALDTGMRLGELLHQLQEHIDFNRRVLSVTKSKTAGGEGREIPLTNRVYALFVSIRQPKGLVFTFHGQPIGAVKTAWKAAMRRAAIPYRRFHDLRHTFNTRLMEAGVMQEIRRALMGHSSGKDVNSIYTHIELPVKRDAIRKLEVWVANQPSSKEARNEETKTGTNRIAATDAYGAEGSQALGQEDTG